MYFGAEFVSRGSDDDTLAPDRRRALYVRFGGWGIVLAAGLIREGVDSRESLRAELDRRSGTADFRTLLTDHFGHRADVVKLARAVQQVKTLPVGSATAGDPRLRETLESATAPVTRLEHTEHSFAELAVLRGHYNGTVLLDPPDVAELLRITGEYGHGPHVLLGLPADASRSELQARARERLAHWAGLTADPLYSGSTRRACQIVRRSYELLVARLAGYRPPGAADW